MTHIPGGQGPEGQRPGSQGPGGGRLDRERFVLLLIAAVIATQLAVFALAAGVCGYRALESVPLAPTTHGPRPIGTICPGTLDRLQRGIDSTLNLLLALLGGAALASRPQPPRP